MTYYQPQLTYVPSSITNRAVMVYLLALVGCNLIFMSHALNIIWWVFGVVEVTVFFIFSNQLTRRWSAERKSEKWFAKNLFTTALLIRIAVVLIMYWFNMQYVQDIMGYDNADAQWYDKMAQAGATWLLDGHWNVFDCFREQYGYGSGTRKSVAFSDIGFPLYLTYVYFLSGNDPIWSILFARLMNCVWGAWTVLLIYRLSQRNFGENVARIAAVLCMLQPNLIIYCENGLKEVLMVFLTVLFTERADNMLRSKRLVIGPTLFLMAIVFYLFMIRTALAAILILALLTALVLSSHRVVKWRRRMALIAIASLFGGIMILQNTTIMADVESLSGDRLGEQRRTNEWRTTRIDKAGKSQSFARYAGAAVFAPLIFTVPFPSMVDTAGQELQKMRHGGNFCKNITSFFTIFALLLLLFSGDWRRHVLPIAVLCGYLIVLVFSNFAHSERFHQPTLPFAMMFAAYAISKFKEKKKYNTYFTIWLGVMFIAAIAWNWFKLAGRGLA
ncbi:MAG: glycosyltransferase family 39 protein [Paludibacteraceae bacterium]|nr:glycosyltransferase family 39 protein [Paludibacteraceae bacterium]